jgi:hypothetical protein
LSELNDSVDVICVLRSDLADKTQKLNGVEVRIDFMKAKVASLESRLAVVEKFISGIEQAAESQMVRYEPPST